MVALVHRHTGERAERYCQHRFGRLATLRASPNPASMRLNVVLRKDPTRTLQLRQAFVREMNTRFRIIKQKIWDAVVTQDVFGLNEGPRGPLGLAARSSLPRQAFAFRKDPEKVAGFMSWLQEEVNMGLLGIQKGAARKVVGSVPWANVYIDSAFKRGMKRSDAELTKAGIPVSTVSSRTRLPIDAKFNTPIYADRVASIYSRAYTDLKGITDAMEHQISRSLAEGLAEGRGPRQIARILLNRVEKAGGDLAITDDKGTVTMRALQRARILARTEVIRAHHVGMIATYREAGLEGVVVQAEWATAGDDRVCELCEGMSGKIFTLDAIEGLIPLHPQCRCVALPYLDKIGGKGWRLIEEGVWQPPMEVAA